MSPVLLDTQVFAWGLDHDRRLTWNAAQQILAADAVWVSPISFYEIGQKVRLGKWPEMAAFVDRLQDLAEAEGANLVPLDAAIALRAAKLDWLHRDPFDRFIAATAMELKAPLVSSDAAFDGLSPHADWRGRIW